MIARFEILGVCQLMVPDSSCSIPAPSGSRPGFSGSAASHRCAGFAVAVFAGDLSGSMIGYSLEAMRLTDRISGASSILARWKRPREDTTPAPS